MSATATVAHAVAPAGTDRGAPDVPHVKRKKAPIKRKKSGIDVDALSERKHETVQDFRVVSLLQ